MKKIFIYFIASFLLLAALLAVYIIYSAALHDNSVVATVNGEPVTYREYNQSLHMVRSEVISKFLAQSKEKGGDFWTTAINGVTPRDALRKAALDKAVQYKVAQMLAKEKKVIDDITYTTFLKDMKAENGRRKLALANQQPIYGPQQYTEEIYYDVENANWAADTKKMIAKEADFSDSDILKYYQSEYQRFSGNPRFIDVQTLSATYHPDDAQSRATVKKTVDALRESVLSGADFKTAAGEYNAIYSEETIDLKTSGRNPSFSQSFLSVVQSLSQGGISDVYDEGDAFVLVKRTDTQESQVQSVEDVKDILITEMAGNKYDQMIKELIKSAVVDIHEKIYRQIKE